MREIERTHREYYFWVGCLAQLKQWTNISSFIEGDKLQKIKEAEKNCCDWIPPCDHHHLHHYCTVENGFWFEKKKMYIENEISEQELVESDFKQPNEWIRTNIWFIFEAESPLDSPVKMRSVLEARSRFEIQYVRIWTKNAFILTGK